MKVVIALTSFSGHLSGVQRHALNLARCLLTRREVSELHLIAAPWQKGSLHAAPLEDGRVFVHWVKVANSSLSRNAWYYFQLPKSANQLKADIVHLAYPMPLRRRRYRCPVIVTLHDLYPYDVPENFGILKAIFNRCVLHQCLRSADAVACVSQSTLARLETVEPLLALRKATVISNCVEHQQLVSSQSPLPMWKGEPFLLCVAQHRHNKNILFLLRVFKHLLLSRQLTSGMLLVIVGLEGPETKAILSFLATSQLQERVVLLHGISDPELQWCYRRCELLVAPSLAEGFGLPVSEALLAGCRVVCSDIPAFREVGGDYCRFIPLNDRADDAFAEAISATLREPPGRLVALPQLSAAPLAEKYLRLYRSLLQAGPLPESLPLDTAISAPKGETAV